MITYIVLTFIPCLVILFLRYIWSDFTEKNKRRAAKKKSPEPRSGGEGSDKLRLMPMREAG